jgi:hypothetical protein
MTELLRSRTLWAMVAGGLVLRLVLAYGWFSPADFEADLNNFRLVHTALADDPLGMYGELNPPCCPFGDYVNSHWPYPPGMVPWIELAVLAENLGLPFHGTFSVLPILCEIAIALAVYAFLGLRGASERTKLIAAALVLFGPSFFAVTAYHGQFDAATALPMVLALIAWTRAPPESRAVWAGGLLGVGALIKWVPLLLVVALLPSVRSWREALIVAGLPALMVGVGMLPFLLHDPDGVSRAFGYGGQPGIGGLSVIVNPEIPTAFLERDLEALGNLNSAGDFLHDNAPRITLAGVALLGLFFWRTRPSPLDAAVMLWVTVFVFGPSWSFTYVIWGLPLMLMAGYLRAVVLIQGALLLPTIFWYDVFGLAEEGADLYPVIMDLVWVMWVAGLVVLGRRIVLARRRQPEGVLEPLVRYGRPVPSASAS